eukprot:gb/GECH01001900.1/.p1 GENE.gb/GECH01001900.1/~~gb/GECH01001900.1/.p1  ORF type:complete len:204 (+),score=43.32 gb/GECH01001900.1/:1-612(+)
MNLSLCFNANNSSQPKRPVPFTLHNNVSCCIKNGINQYLTNETVYVLINHSTQKIKAHLNDCTISGEEYQNSLSLSKIILKDGAKCELSQMKQFVSLKPKFKIYRNDQKIGTLTKIFSLKKIRKYQVNTILSNQELIIFGGKDANGLSIYRGEELCASTEVHDFSTESINYTLQVKEGEDIILMLSIATIVKDQRLRKTTVEE